MNVRGVVFWTVYGLLSAAVVVYCAHRGWALAAAVWVVAVLTAGVNAGMDLKSTR